MIVDSVPHFNKVIDCLLKSSKMFYSMALYCESYSKHGCAWFAKKESAERWDYANRLAGHVVIHGGNVKAGETSVNSAFTDYATTLKAAIEHDRITLETLSTSAKQIAMSDPIELEQLSSIYHMLYKDSLEVIDVNDRLSKSNVNSVDEYLLNMMYSMEEQEKED